MAAAAAIAGRSSGSVIVRKRVQAVAPSVAAACSRAGSRWVHSPPTVRTTTARLKKTWAARTIQIVPARSIPSIPFGPASCRNAIATTTVGSTNGMVTRVRTRPRPGKSKRETAQVTGRPTASVSRVDTTACQVVNQTAWSVLLAVRIDVMRPGSAPSPVAMIDAIGQAKNTRPTVTAGSARRARRRVIGARSPSTR